MNYSPLLMHYWNNFYHQHLVVAMQRVFGKLVTEVEGNEKNPLVF